MLALKFGTVLTLDGYLQATVSQMSEAFEDILLDMDRELTNLAEHKHKVLDSSNFSYLVL